MAWLEQKKSGTYHIVFRIGADKYRRSLKTKHRKEASARKSRIEENLRLVESGRLTIPEDSDIVSFLLSDGKLSGHIKAPRKILLGRLFEQYSDALPAESMEANSLGTAEIHMKHIATNLSPKLELRNLNSEHLQTYINARASQPGRFGKNISTTTIKKELSTLRTLWNWAITHDYVSKPLLLRGLRFPKVDEKPPFRTREEIEREIEIGNLTHHEQQELWQCLYLRTEEISEILSIIKRNARFHYLYPMVTVAAYTGARRSELCRSQHRDMQLTLCKFLLREKKRNSSKRTYRQVPITESLESVLTDWLLKRSQGTDLPPINSASHL